MICKVTVAPNSTIQQSKLSSERQKHPTLQTPLQYPTPTDQTPHLRLGTKAQSQAVPSAVSQLSPSSPYSAGTCCAEDDRQTRNLGIVDHHGMMAAALCQASWRTSGKCMRCMDDRLDTKRLRWRRDRRTVGLLRSRAKREDWGEVLVSPPKKGCSKIKGVRLTVQFVHG